MNAGNEPATKAEVQVLAAQYRSLMSLYECLAEEVKTMRADIETVRARILGSVYQLEESSLLRLSEEEAVSAGIIDRLAFVDDRLLEIEKRIDTPPKK